MKEIKMDNEIKEFKKKNGNSDYTIKELLGGIYTKFDRLEDKIDTIKERLAKGDREFGEIEGIMKTRGLVLKIGFPILISMMGGLLMLILKLHRIL